MSKEEPEKAPEERVILFCFTWVALVTKYIKVSATISTFTSGTPVTVPCLAIVPLVEDLINLRSSP